MQRARSWSLAGRDGDVPSSQTPSILLLLHDNLLRRSLLILHRRALLVVLLLRGPVVALGRAILVAVAGEVSIDRGSVRMAMRGCGSMLKSV
jgi:hypothetical protein